MAISISEQYPGKTAGNTTNYPLGEARNVTTPGDGTGTPWEQAIVNDDQGFKQALLAAAGLTPSGIPDTALVSQYLQALQKLFPAMPTLAISGTAWSFELKAGARTILVQGNRATSGNNTAIVFPKAYPNACLSLQLTDAAGNLDLGYSGLTKTGFTLRSAGTVSYDYFAIGW